jgi:hypothetical protein
MQRRDPSQWLEISCPEQQTRAVHGNPATGNPATEGYSPKRLWVLYQPTPFHNETSKHQLAIFAANGSLR